MNRYLSVSFVWLNAGLLKKEILTLLIRYPTNNIIVCSERLNDYDRMLFMRFMFHWTVAMA